MKQMHILSNSHLDREHRHEFQETRLMMVEMMDDVLDIMESDINYKHFTLDGQAIVIDDYLEMRPENKARLKALIKEGRIIVGPWYSLVDCYSVTPESIIRNLLIGDRICHEYGQPMKVGYSIFSFGQMAQLPQVYAGFDIHDIVFYKGASTKEFPNSEFFWKSPDGTKAFTTRLGREKRWNFFFDFDIPVILGGDAKRPGWQSKFTDDVRLCHMIDDAHKNEYATEINPDIRIREEKIDDAIDTVLSLLDETKSQHVLAAFDGTDFTSPLREIPQAIEIINERRKGKLELVHSTPEKYFEELKKDIKQEDLICYEGEMRFGPVNHVHSETMGTNTDIKQGIWYSENEIINVIEPIAAMAKFGGKDCDDGALELAWKYLLQTHAHDSVHGSGDPKIKTDNLARLAQVKSLTKSLTRRAVNNLCSEIRFDENQNMRIVLINTTPYKRSEVINLTIDLPRDELVEDFWLTDENNENVDFYPVSESSFNLAMIHRTNRPKTVYSDRREVIAFVKNIPENGYKTLYVQRKKGSNETNTNPFPTGIFPFAPIAKSGNVLDNGLLRVTLNAGSINVYDYQTGKTSSEMNAFTSIGSSGDFWVHREPAHNTHISTKGGNTQIELIENSSLRATYRMICSMDVPKGLNTARNARSGEKVKMTVTSDVTLAKDSKRIDFKTTVDNKCADQLFTVSFPTGIQAKTANWEAPFEIRKRDVDNSSNDRLKKGAELERQALGGFIDIYNENQGVALFTKGIREAGTTADNGAIINLTLFRACTNTFPIHNDLLIGFNNETSQCIGELKFEYALLFHCENENVLEQCRKYQTNIICAQVGKGSGGCLPSSMSLFTLKDNKTAVSCIKYAQDGKGLILRLFNPYATDIAETVSFNRNIKEVGIANMNESVYKKLEINNNSFDVELPAYKIVTISIEI